MKKLALTTALLSLSVGTGTNASTHMADANTFFNNEAHGFEGNVKLVCQAKGDVVADTISAIVDAASTLFVKTSKRISVTRSWVLRMIRMRRPSWKM